jgi:hypothetical protein
MVAVTMAAMPLLIWQAVEPVSKWFCSSILRHLTIIKRGGRKLLLRTRITQLKEGEVLANLPCNKDV